MSKDIYAPSVINSDCHDDVEEDINSDDFYNIDSKSTLLTNNKHNQSKINLLSKLESHISSDLNQIQNVFDNKIKETNLLKDKLKEDIDRKFEVKISNINIEREKEISNYNNEAEKRISELIYNLNNPKNNTSYFSMFNLFNGLF